MLTLLLLGLISLLLLWVVWKYKEASEVRRALVPGSEYKMVLLVRSDLTMTKGKIAAQCCHGALAAYKKTLKTAPKELKVWEETGQAKIALRVSSLEILQNIIADARKAGLVTASIQDAGKTQLAPGTTTIGVIGPHPKALIDPFTQHLKLL